MIKMTKHDEDDQEMGPHIMITVSEVDGMPCAMLCHEGFTAAEALDVLKHVTTQLHYQVQEEQARMN